MNKKMLQWVVINGIFAALVGVGWYSNYSWANYARNMVYFASWVMLMVSFLTIGASILIVYIVPKLKAQQKKDILRIPLTTTIPTSLDILYDSAIVLAMAASGNFLIATVYTLAQFCTLVSILVRQQEKT